MTAEQIFKHEGMKFDNWLQNLLNVEKIYTHGKNTKKTTAVFRRHQIRFVKRLVDLVQKLTPAPGQVST
jgi:hypothetical protein